MGIVASCLAEQYACPVFMICLQEDGRGKGSCRSCKNFNLFSALEQCADLLEDYGGHALAAGVHHSGGEHPRLPHPDAGDRPHRHGWGRSWSPPSRSTGRSPTPPSLTVEEVEGLSMLEPYGAGNPKPVFSLSGVTVTCMSDVGGGRHLKMRASRDGRTVDMIFFSMTRAKSGLNVGDRADVAFYPQINDYRGVPDGAAPPGGPAPLLHRPAGERAGPVPEVRPGGGHLPLRGPADDPPAGGVRRRVAVP